MLRLGNKNTAAKWGVQYHVVPRTPQNKHKYKKMKLFWFFKLNKLDAREAALETSVKNLCFVFSTHMANRAAIWPT